MRAQFGRWKRQTQGDPVFRIRHVQSRELPANGEVNSSHVIAPFATSFRHSVVAFEARSTRLGSRTSIGERTK